MTKTQKEDLRMQKTGEYDSSKVQQPHDKVSKKYHLERDETSVPKFKIMMTRMYKEVKDDMQKQVNEIHKNMHKHLMKAQLK